MAEHMLISAHRPKWKSAKGGDAGKTQGEHDGERRGNRGERLVAGAHATDIFGTTDEEVKDAVVASMESTKAGRTAPAGAAQAPVAAALRSGRGWLARRCLRLHLVDRECRRRRRHRAGRRRGTRGASASCPRGVTAPPSRRAAGRRRRSSRRRRLRAVSRAMPPPPFAAATAAAPEPEPEEDAGSKKRKVGEIELEEEATFLAANPGAAS